MSVVGKGVLAETGPALERFFGSGVLGMGDKLGPFFWQFMPAKKFDPKDVEAFFKMLPKEKGGVNLRHAIEARHVTFACAEFVDLARAYGVSIVLVDSDKHPLIADVTGEFLYLRLQRTQEKVATGYKPAEIKTTAENLKGAIEGESYERDKMYTDFIAEARSNGNTDALKTFNFAKVAEGEHAKLYAEALANLADWKGGKTAFFVCSTCGYATSDVNLQKCPVDFTPKEKFESIS